jgi:hypothetical protein
MSWSSHRVAGYIMFSMCPAKRAIGQHITPLEVLLPLDEEGKLVLIPEEILEVRENKLRKRSIKEYLIKWKDLPIEDVVNVYAIIIVLCISIDKSIIRTRSLRNTHSQETQHLSRETF